MATDHTNYDPLRNPQVDYGAKLCFPRATRIP